MRCADLHLRTAVAADAAAIARIHTESWQLDYRDILKHAYLDDEAPAERLALWLSRMGGDAPPRVLLAEIHSKWLPRERCSAGFRSGATPKAIGWVLSLSMVCARWLMEHG